MLYPGAYSDEVVTVQGDLAGRRYLIVLYVASVRGDAGRKRMAVSQCPGCFLIIL